MTKSLSPKGSDLLRRGHEKSIILASTPKGLTPLGIGSKSYCHRRLGLSLLELIAVTTILSLVSLTIVVSFRGVLQGTRFDFFCNKLSDFDDRARRVATGTSDRIQIKFIPEQGLIQSSRWSGGKQNWITLKVPSEIRVDQVLKSGEDFQLTRWDRGQPTAIAISSQGGSSSYAIKLVGKNEQRWVVFLGGSGQSWETEDENDVRELLAR